jgi:ribonuclease P protein component
MPKFTKQERLLSRKAIQQIFDEGNTFVSYPFRFIYIIKTEVDDGHMKLAFSIPKKNFRRAVDRNLLKRRLKEIYRLNKSQLYSQLKDKNIYINLMIIYTGRSIFLYNDLEVALKKAFEQWIKEI